VRAAWTAWKAEAQRVVDEDIGDHIDQVRADAAAKLEELQAEIDAINEALRFDLTDFDVPDVPGIPEANLTGKVHSMGLLDSSWSFTEQCKRLIDSKAYTQTGIRKREAGSEGGMR
jgi:hypothetical protein